MVAEDWRRRLAFLRAHRQRLFGALPEGVAVAAPRSRHSTIAALLMSLRHPAKEEEVSPLQQRLLLLLLASLLTRLTRQWAKA